MKKKIFVVLLVLVAVATLLSGCDLGESTNGLTTKATLETGAAASATSTPTKATAVVGTATLEPLAFQSKTTAGEIYQYLAPSIAYIDTPTGTGSGIVYAGGYVVTNAHVVWPFETVRVVLPDGSEYIDTPVVGTDLMVDLAVIGPIDTIVPGASFANLDDLQIGDTVYLIGYPGEGDAFPQPALTQGLVSLLRFWEKEGITYIQSDAAIAGGQSGGALVSSSGQIIGISGFSFSDVFALVAATQDLVDNIDALIAGGDPSGLAARNNILTGASLYRDTIELDNYWDSQTYVIDQPLDTEVQISVDGRNDVAMTLLDSYGDVGVTADEGIRGTETLVGTIDWSGPYFLIVEQYTEDSGTFSLESNVPLIPLNDPDDVLTIVPGTDTIGNIDYPGDMDVFLLSLERGQTVTITVDSIAIDGYVTVDYQGATENEIEWDDDSGYGLFALNASLEYTAPQTGIFYVVVEDATQYETGGYHLIIEEAN